MFSGRETQHAQSQPRFDRTQPSSAAIPLKCRRHLGVCVGTSARFLSSCGLSYAHDSATCRLAEKFAHSELASPYRSWCTATYTWNNADKNSNQHGCHSSRRPISACAITCWPSCKASCCRRGSRVSTESGAQAQPSDSGWHWHTRPPLNRPLVAHHGHS